MGLLNIKYTSSQINEAKIFLYAALLSLEPEEITESEVNIMYELSKDKAIQDVLQTKLNSPCVKY